MRRRSVEGYELMHPDGAPGTTLLVASAWAQWFPPGLTCPDRLDASLPVATWTPGGRAPHPVVRVDSSLWVVKSYRRGGWLARWNQDLYLRGRRFLHELEVLGHAVRNGVPTVAAVALIIRTGAFGLKRAWLVSPFIAGATTLAELLSAPAPAAVTGRRWVTLFRAAGAAVRRMHQAGIDHPDLNLGNLLVVERAGEFASTGEHLPTAIAADADPEIRILDWDRARIGGVDDRIAFKNLLRLLRSGLKLQASPSVLAPCLRGFLRGYCGRDTSRLRRLRRYVRNRWLTGIELHRLFWRSR